MAYILLITRYAVLAGFLTVTFESLRVNKSRCGYVWIFHAYFLVRQGSQDNGIRCRRCVGCIFGAGVIVSIPACMKRHWLSKSRTPSPYLSEQRPPSPYTRADQLTSETLLLFKNHRAWIHGLIPRLIQLSKRLRGAPGKDSSRDQ